MAVATRGVTPVMMLVAGGMQKYIRAAVLDTQDARMRETVATSRFTWEVALDMLLAGTLQSMDT